MEMEWTSLTLFTVLSETAVGLAVLYTLFGFTPSARQKPDAYNRLARPAMLTAWLATGAAMLLSLTHLGHPQFAFRALGGLPSSWLSWEVLLTSLFALGALLLWWQSRTGQAPRWAPVLVSAVGLASVIASGMIYVLPSLPANAGGFPVLLFLATTLTTGGAALLALLSVTEAGRAFAPEWLVELALFTAGAVLLTGLLTFAHTGAAATGLPEARAQAGAMTGSAWYLVRLLVGLAMPAILLLWQAWRPRLSRAALLLPVALLVAGELTGRLLFFASSTFTGINTGL
ncbi:anaerobic dimethyl sulfoxide reductase subunit C (anchor subunit) [Symbiobacterium terraclitae]|uniref:Anaerobic dimethyl sulfoxide reductase subunit C (Anchor subunit) n=1 Tax=Symbiobacterium terraclitae TaxID=557451 RepID=A0ABS4JVN2_9FIRM|nr:DmsC/YnfH family molybdoenzyme membrane anchor subunit [Symbiobacterium terraclitae]MBP2019600.1 anaerobic dimethyl sulfoxide reductase subunit C (anchor subunit) [Symbiobacterium terraclitae]